MTGSIDTEIPGSTESVHSAADWLYGLKSSLHDARTMFSNCQTQAGSRLEGETADAVVAYAGDVEDACDDTYNRSKKAADVTRAFADQLGWRQEDMSNHRARAVDGGLTVSGYIIHAPEPVEDPGSEPSNATSAQKRQWQADCDAYDAYVEKQELFDELREDVDHTFNELTEWINDHLAPAEDQVFAVDATNAIRGALYGIGKGAASYVGTTLAKNEFEERAAALRAKAIDIATKKARRKSGNPAVSRSKVKPPSQGSVQKKIRDSPKLTSMLNSADDMVRRAVAAIKTYNVVTTLGSIYADLASGKSPAETFLKAGVSLAAAGAVGVAVGAATTLPGIVVAGLAVGGAAWAAAEGAGLAYENLVPLHVRERIDEGLRDAGDRFADTVDDAKDAVVDGAQAVGEWVSDRWRSAFG